MKISSLTSIASKLPMPKTLIISLVGLIITAAVAFANSGSRSAVDIPDPAVDMQATGEQTAVFAGGCFWGMEGVFEHLKGVSDVMTGYAGGDAVTATYQQVSQGSTQHAESVQVVYDPAQISYGELLKIYFFVAHDPTQLNRQGPDHGVQYRSEIFSANDDQKRVAEAYIKQLDQAKVFEQPIATQITPLDQFYAAEPYHQDFIDRNPLHPYVVVHDLPQIRQLQSEFPNMYSATRSR
jgi:peptide-methionine (S)-S-oxide reductase